MPLSPRGGRHGCARDPGNTSAETKTVTGTGRAEGSAEPAERAAVEDAVTSVRFAAPFSDEVSVNPVNVQNGTAVERLWKRGEYRSPWIWSLIEVLRTCAGCGPRIMSSPSGGGSQRGVHNCGSCDRRALDAVERFSFSQDVRDLDVTCDCFKKWKAYCAAETMLGTPADLDRALDADLAVR